MEFFKAIKDDNLGELRRLLEHGADANVVDDNNKGNTPLHFAVEENKEHMVRHLLLPQWNIDVNAQNSNGDTPLHTSALRGNNKIVCLLLKRQILDNTNIKKKQTFMGVIKKQVCNTSSQLQEVLGGVFGAHKFSATGR